MAQTIYCALLMVLVSLTSGCMMLGLTPLPGHVAEVSVPAEVSNTELRKKILGFLVASGVNDCSSKHEKCEPNGLVGVDVTSVGPSSAISLINHYTKYDRNRVGIGMKVERTTANVVRVTARGVGPYYNKLPTEDAAKAIAAIISSGLSYGSG